jgi:hypothetical protein
MTILSKKIESQGRERGPRLMMKRPRTPTIPLVVGWPNVARFPLLGHPDKWKNTFGTGLHRYVISLNSLSTIKPDSLADVVVLRLTPLRRHATAR